MKPASFAFPTTIHFGPGVRARLVQELDALAIRRPLVVTDRGVAALGWFGELAAALAAAPGVQPAVFSELAGNPRAAHLQAALGAYRAHRADGVVAIGGGAATDVAKATALLASNPGGIFEYATDAPAPRRAAAPLPPVLALPSTAGTGSEVGRSAVISEDTTGRKRVIFEPAMLPRVVLADPELLLGLPPELTAATGMDALSHLIESFCATEFHPLCDGIALEGLRLVDAALVRSVQAPHDLQARGRMLLASIMGAVAFQKGLGLTHACAHALSAVLDTHHGLANGVLLGWVLRFNTPAAGERLRRMAVALELAEPSAEGLLAWLEALRARVGIPGRLGALGVRPEHLDRLAELAAADGCLATNPRPATREEIRALLAQAL
ncbi:MAG: alcohol dehydrogenase [Planctomycetota bacterium]|nr:MAG: alcohol dehydrogenase [Planctomycetota bacterium]